ncbi:mannan endo-1,4-beta-mannosidase [Oxobacter pfennigii]|uniref:Mannan endo-1,4-beta-mannosidase n=1 Tax=Oxobacter pfennigii TaxID=36849 RepID=A0A0P9AIG0_9CLOT|nr:glycosyl hydrolase [Oxobacter pfennigii]KPU45253.1 mannan endo-1,4-beta-mannosidase [Oxobacter pfennigii]
MMTLANLKYNIFLKSIIFYFSLMTLMYIVNILGWDINIISPCFTQKQFQGMEKKEDISMDAHVNMIKVMKYLKSIYGSKVLSGQHISQDLLEVDAIYKVTGKKPALIGFDFMDSSPSRVKYGANGTDIKRAVRWWNEGGLVTFCWHWNAPAGLINKRPDKQWYRGFYTEATTFNFAKGIRNVESEEYRLMIRDMDAIAEELKKLQKAGVPILWRPLHEASGGWFWWGSRGPEPYKKLWRIMYERFTNYHGLDNLIWVWNGEHQDWYPGDDVVDIVGIDFYGLKHDYSPRQEEFKVAEAYSGAHKMVALTETGVIPDPELMLKTGAKWLWYLTWSEELVLADDKKSYSEEYTEAWMLKKAYLHETVITRDELPSFR